MERQCGVGAESREPAESCSLSRFELTTQGESGAPIGSHTVTVTALEEPGAEYSEETADDSRPAPPPKSRIPAKYSNREESGLSAVVSDDATQNNFEFDLVN